MPRSNMDNLPAVSTDPAQSAMQPNPRYKRESLYRTCRALLIFYLIGFSGWAAIGLLLGTKVDVDHFYADGSGAPFTTTEFIGPGGFTVLRAVGGALGGTALAIFFLRLSQLRRNSLRQALGLCTHCGYDLRGGSAICPEC